MTMIVVFLCFVKKTLFLAIINCLEISRAMWRGLRAGNIQFCLGYCTKSFGHTFAVVLEATRIHLLTSSLSFIAQTAREMKKILCSKLPHPLIFQSTS